MRVDIGLLITRNYRNPWYKNALKFRYLCSVHVNYTFHISTQNKRSILLKGTVTIGLIFIHELNELLTIKHYYTEYPT